MVKTTDIPKEKAKSKFSSFIKPVLKWSARLVMLLFFLFLLAFFLLKIPSIQEKAIRTTEGFLSKEMKTEVSVKKISLESYDKIGLDSLLILDLKGDTLLFVNHLTANINSGPYSWYNRTLILEDVILEGADLQIRRTPQDLKSNLKEYINLLKPKKKSGRKPFFLQMETLFLDNTKVTNDDTRKGERHRYFLKKGIIEVESIDISKEDIYLDDIRLEEPFGSIEKITKDTVNFKVNDLVKKSSGSDTSKLFIAVESLTVTNGIFTFDNNRYEEREWPEKVFDNRHWMTTNINMVHEELTYKNDVIRSQIKSGSLKENSGFEVLTFGAKAFEFSDTKMGFYDLAMTTPNSTIGDTLVLKYRDLGAFGDFNNEVYITAKMDESVIGFKDLLTFSRPLNNNLFFNKNEKEYLKISGELKGKVNSLKGYDLAVDLGKGLKFFGDFRSRDLAVKDEEYLDLEVKRLRTTMNTLIELVPTFSPPENFKKLGNLNFNGNFLGFLNDFVAFGDLRSDLGRATMDMNLNVKSGRETATYSGNLSLDHFDLGKWTDDSDFGWVTFNSQVKEGIGLTGESAVAQLNATIDTFHYKNYRYENIAINGGLAQKLFNGKLEIHDDNIDLTFAGKLDFKNEIPKFIFKSNINILDLQKLNISKEKLVFSGAVDMDIRNQKFSKMEGEVAVRSISMTRGDDSFKADSIILRSNFKNDSISKIFEIDSDILTANLDGVFDIEQIHLAFSDYYLRNFPQFMKKFGVKPSKKAPKLANFDFDIKLLNIKNLSKLIHPRLDTLQGLTAKGYFDTFEDKLQMDLFVPKMKVSGWDLYDIGVQNKLKTSDGHLNLSITKTEKGKTTLAPLIVFGLVESDTIEFGLTHTFNFQTIEDLNLDGKFFINKDAYQINFDPSSLVIGKREWEIPALNYLRFGKNTVETKNFRLTNDDKSIVIESNENNRGLNFELQNFNLDFIEELWSYKPLDFSGNFTLNGTVNDIFNLSGISISSEAKSFLVNGDDFGKMNLEARLKDLKSITDVRINLVKDDQKLLVDGRYFLPSAVKAMKTSGNKNTPDKNYFDINVDLLNYPVSMLEYWVTDGISNTDGKITSTDLRIFGYPGKPEISGTATTENAVTTINFLNTTYWVEKGQIVLNNEMIDASGSILRDAKGNFANVDGGLTHVWLKNLGMKARIKTDRFEALNTQKKEGSVFYGYAIGSGDIKFSGDFKQTNIDVIAKTGEGTSIKVPIVYDNSSSEVSFIKFIDKKKNKTETDVAESGTIALKGINLKMQLNVTEDAEMFLIFDERVGDVIRGRGRGNIDMKVLRDGTFSMNGNYEIDSGDYLFTMINIVNKKFKVERGGTIRWFGDPFGAEINIEAKYSGLNTPVSSLIVEYLGLMSDDLKREAGQGTNVNLTLLLKGQLLKPEISFDIDFPDLSGELKTYAQSKLRVLKQNQNELNRQVFGLIVTGQFLPSEFQFSGTDLAFSTISELIANQVTIYLKDILSDLIKDLDYFTDIDFNLAYSTFQNISLANGVNNLNSTSSKVALNLKPYFLDNRLSVNLGGSFNVEDDANNPEVRAGNFNAGDFTVEYAISKDKRLKLKAYASTENTVTGNKQRYGAGISYRREFDNFAELFSGIKKEVKKLKK